MGIRLELMIRVVVNVTVHASSSGRSKRADDVHEVPAVITAKKTMANRN